MYFPRPSPPADPEASVFPKTLPFPAVRTMAGDGQPGAVDGSAARVNRPHGLSYAKEGSLFFGDEDVTRLAPHKRNTGMMFQSYALWPHMTVAQNVAYGLDVRGVTAGESAARVGPLPARDELGALADHERVAPPSITKVVTKLEADGLVGGGAWRATRRGVVQPRPASPRSRSA